MRQLFYFLSRQPEYFYSLLFFLVNILTNLIHKAIYQIYSIDLSQGKFLDVDKRLSNNYSNFVNSYDEISCQACLKSVSPVYLQAWLDRLFVERLENRSEIIHKDLQDTRGNWREVVYRQLARNFGQKINEYDLHALEAALKKKKKG